MVSDRKCKWMVFVDYLLTLLLSILGLFFLSPVLNQSWGLFAYSILFSLVFFGFVYSRLWKKAKSDLKYDKENMGVKKALRLIAPSAIFFLVIAVLFALIRYNILPIRDMVVGVRYILVENQPRVMQEVYLFDNIAPFARLLFPMVVGFQPRTETLAWPLFLVPAMIAVGGILGYIAGVGRFELSDYIIRKKQKLVDKFNE